MGRDLVTFLHKLLHILVEATLTCFFSSQLCPINVSFPDLKLVSRVSCKFLFIGLTAIIVLAGSKALA